MLAACHERIQSRCELLDRLVVHWTAQGLTGDVRASANDVVAYFSTAGQQHHQDEEYDLFPLLRGDPGLARTLDELSHEHREMDALWMKLETRLTKPETVQNLDALALLAREFCSRQSRHIEIENRQVLPQARLILPREILGVIGSRMAARRGISP